MGSELRRDLRDWRLWALLALMLAIFAFDVLVPPVVVLPFLAVPVIAAALFTGPRTTAVLAVLVIVMALLSDIVNDYFATVNGILWVSALVVVGVIAVGLAARRQSADDALVASEERFRLLAENASDIVMLRDPDGRIEWISPSVQSVLGWRPLDLVGSDSLVLVHPDDVPEVSRIRTAVAAGQVRAGGTTRIRRRDGSYLNMAAMSRPVFAAGGRLQRVVVGLRDVDDLVRARQRADEESAYLKATLDAEFDPHIVLEGIRDETGRIVDLLYVEANPAACQYNGMSRDVLVGARMLDLMPGLLGSGMFHEYVCVLETGEPLVLNDYAYPQEILGGQERRYDTRVVRFGDRLSMTWRDVTDRFLATAAIRASEEQYRLLAENSSDVVVRVQHGLFTWVSPGLGEALGWAESAWVGRPAVDFIHPDDLDGLDSVRQGLIAGRRMVFRVRVLSRGGVYHWTEAHAAPYLGADGRADGISASFRVVDAEVRAQRELDRAARYDDLTGLLNRKEVLTRIPHVMAHPRRTGDRTAVLFCDIDRLKGLNDELGHVIGDEVIRTVADRVRASVRNDDLVARLGGDELLVVLDGVHDLDNALQVAETVRAAVATPMLAGETMLTPTVSVGVTLAEPGESIDAIIARADDAMYSAKHHGRDRVVAVPPPA